jgi:hypothetical protein
MLTLINGEKLIIRESCAQVTEKVLAYRAYLLTTVARRLPSIADLQPVASISSLSETGQIFPMKQRNDSSLDY